MKPLPGLLKIAGLCLLESCHADDLRPYAALNLEAPDRDALIRNGILKSDRRFPGTKNEFSIIPGE